MKGLIDLPKIIVSYSLEKKEKIEKEARGIINNNRLIFNDGNYDINIQIIDDYLIMKRENKEIISEMNFNQKSSCKYFLKKYNKYVTFDIELIKLVIKENNIELVYKIEDDIFNFNLHYEVIKC